MGKMQVFMFWLIYEFSSFITQLDKMPYGLTIYMDQSIYEWTSNLRIDGPIINGLDNL